MSVVIVGAGVTGLTLADQLTGKGRDDEDNLTDLLNERTRGGWQYHDMSQVDTDRVAVVFERET